MTKPAFDDYSNDLRSLSALAKLYNTAEMFPDGLMEAEKDAFLVESRRFALKYGIRTSTARNTAIHIANTCKID